VKAFRIGAHWGIAALSFCVLVVLVLIVGARWLSPNPYTAMTAAVQTLVVTLALSLALVTYRADARDRRVDRVIALHQEFYEDNFHDQRQALVQVLRRRGPAPYPPLPDEEVRQEGLWHARSRVIRYFERVHLARVSGALDDYLAASLIGRHATWWDLALQHTHSTGREPLHEFANWSNDFAKHCQDDSAFRNWGQTRTRDFGRVSCTEPQPAASPSA